MTEEAVQAPSRKSSRGSRRGRGTSAGRGSAGLAQLPLLNIKNPYQPLEILDEEGIEKIHNASLRVLEEIGIEFMLPEARDMWKAAGADVDMSNDRVRFDRGMIEELVAKAPSEFTLHARHPEKSRTIGGSHMNFCSVASAPNSSDIDHGRRSGNKKDYQNFIRLGQTLNSVHIWGGYPVEPVDIHSSVRHLECIYDFITLSDKPYHAYSLGKERNLDALEMTRIAYGYSDAELAEKPSLFTVINANSPLKMDTPMLQGILEMSSRNQVVVLTPFTLAGAMAPITLAGALAQQNAEALAGIAFTQLVRPGAPVVYGGFTSNVDMKSGAPAFGTPEYTKAALIGGQLTRRYGIPYRSSNVNASNAVDVQAAYESQMSLWGALMGQSQFLMHAAGWLEGGLCASFEKMVLDAEMLQMMQELMKPLDLSEDAFGFEAVKEVGPGGHFFGTEHTQARYKDAFYSPFLADWRNFETWSESGGRNATERANSIYKSVIESYQAPEIDPAIVEELDAFVAKRKEEGGAPSDF